MGAFQLVVVFMNQGESSQQKPLPSTVSPVQHSTSSTVIAEEERIYFGQTLIYNDTMFCVGYPKPR